MRTMTDKPEFTSFEVFQFLGYLLGGIMPVTLFLMLPMLDFEQTIMDEKYMNRFLFIALFGGVIGFVAFYVKGKYTERHWLFKTFFTIQALFSVLLIHLLVLYTGGPKVSVFGLSYLYLPAVVGYTYSSGINLKGAVILLTISYVCNLFWLQEQQNFFKFFVESQNAYSRTNFNSYGQNSVDNVVYLAVFLIQILVTKSIASARVLSPASIGSNINDNLQKE